MTKKFEEFEDPYADLNEIEQAGNLKMAFASYVSEGRYRTQHVFVKCRDFLNDAVIGSDGGYRTPVIYGFSYDGENDPIDRDKTRLVLRVNEAEGKNLRRNLKKFNNMLKSAGMDRTRAWAIDRIGGNASWKYLLVEGDPSWADHITGTSFYTLMLRLMTSRPIPQDESFAEWLKHPETFNFNDRGYIKSFIEVFDHPADFIKNMELLDMQDVHVSVKDDDVWEMEPAHERGGIQEFSKLIRHLRRGTARDYIEREVYIDYNGSFNSRAVTVAYPTMPAALKFA